MLFRAVYYFFILTIHTKHWKKLLRREIPWPYFGHISIIIPVFTVLFEYINNHKIHNHKQLIIIGNALSVPVPGTKGETEMFLFFFMPSTGFVCHAVASRWSTTAQVPVVGQADACGAESIDILQVVINE